MTKEVIIAGACRTAVGSFGGSLKNIPVVRLGAIVISEVLKRAAIQPEEVDEVIMGNVLQAGLGQNPARQVAIEAGISQETPSYTVNKVCGSGLKAVQLAVQAIKAGDADIVIAGGMENMSATPYTVPGARWGQRMGDAAMVDTMIKDGLWDAFNNYHMGVTAENVAKQFEISREEQDAFAFSSQQKAKAAIELGKFKEEIVPIKVPQRRGEPVVFATDEFPRFDTTLEKLAKLKPAFKKDGTVTAGNSSGINDGAAAIVVMSKEKAEELGIEPMATIISYASAGVDPAIMGTGPISASRKALDKIGMTVNELDLIEANEAFAAQAISVNMALKWDLSKVNVNGGAIALGHPIGCSGARILVTLLYEMKKRHSKTGLATLCIGGGMGTAVIVQR